MDAPQLAVIGRLHYQNTEISEYLKRGFVPHKEDLTQLENRVINSLHNWDIKSKDKENYEKVSSVIMLAFNDSFGVDMTQRILIKKKSRKWHMLNAGVAGYAIGKEGVGIIEFVTEKKKSDMGLFVHEALHHVFGNNPFYLDQHFKKRRTIKWDKTYLPIVYHPLDKERTYGEALPESLIETTSFPYPFPMAPSVFGAIIALGSMATFLILEKLPESNLLIDYPSFKSMAEYSPLIIIPGAYIFLNILIKIPRTIINNVRGNSYKRKIKKLESILGTKNTVKLLQVSGPKELKLLSSIVDKL
ncbi:MAG: hypothetical protein KKB39_02575 [Nanoarchaeota archaeon]|nr:hypothetical protein [Nanoarchaeota archaeon]